MPRSRRRRDPEPEPLDLERARAAVFRVEAKRDGAWNVQPISAVAAVKDYVCPGCGGGIAPGVAHIVVWRSDGILGDAHDVAARRHWHGGCWRARS